ncbi:TIGR04222 domain-containing membrane protein [Streptomyces wuyuanensis]|uniref:TIGR04222 domain-containing protein n=1 Tax=Streptomyces wuyuanensis TaxID=1196353 RepID=A0A1G9MS67_9ACTN|nr:TIGR04222 domain-containing membrane protein [Streptomyces wuyuanensis]SDL76943.1 TIGR04222 domain-containing protein [Streptomyces wuyuanensis]
MLWVILLLAAWAAAGISCGRLCLAAAAAADGGHGPDTVHDREDETRTAGDQARGPHGKRQLSLYEAAFLAGGPHRVTTLTLVSMHRARRLLLAHTGWVTVVDPEGEDDLERSLIDAIGPGGQSPIATARRAAESTEAVRALSERLVVSGLAVPEAIRSGLAGAMRAVRAAAAFTVALAAVALLVLPHEPGSRGTVAVWFALPLVLTLGCLVIARVEVHPYTRWASPAGRLRLRGLVDGRDGSGPPDGEPGFLTDVAVNGVRALDDPALRSVLDDRWPTRRA